MRYTHPGGGIRASPLDSTGLAISSWKDENAAHLSRTFIARPDSCPRILGPHTDRAARTANARKAMLDKFERQVDPNGTLAQAERAKRAEHARKAYFKRLALKSAQARRRRGGGS